MPAVGPLGVQLATPKSVVSGRGQVVVFQPFPEVAAAAVQLATGALLVVIAGGHDVVVKLLPAFGVVTGVQLATGTLTVEFAEQAVVAMKLELTPGSPLVHAAAGWSVVITGVAHTLLV